MLYRWHLGRNPGGFFVIVVLVYQTALLPKLSSDLFEVFFKTGSEDSLCIFYVTFIHLDECSVADEAAQL